MSKKKKEISKTEIEENKDIYVSEETIELDSTQKNENELVEQKEENSNKEYADETQTAIDNAVKEYNGEIKEQNSEERRIRVREKADVASISKINKKAIIISSLIIFAIIMVLVAFGIINKMNPDVYKNIYLEGQEVSGMTSVEFADYLKLEQEKLGNTSLKIMQDKEEILEIVPADINFEIDIAAVQEKVFGYGRDSNLFKNNIDIACALIFKKEFALSYKYDVSKLSDIVKEIKESLDNKVVNDSYVLDEKEYKLIITRGKSGNTIEEEQVKAQITKSLANGMGEYKLYVVTGNPQELDIDLVYSQVKRNAEDAYIDKSKEVHKFVPHKVGLDFDKEDLEKILLQEENKQESKVIEYKLKVIEPKVKTSDIKWNMYEYKISSFTTYFSTADQNRVTNLRVALNLLNGKVIMPGEVFSYNSVVGAATAAQGFKPAATFSGGRVISEVGGGICQTVSTLYNTALLANLEIVQRKAHSLPVGYVPESRDATVYYPSIDFKFKNTREYPIKIVTAFNKNGSLTISLYGTKQDNEYVVSITSKRLSTIGFKTQTVNDSALEKGKQTIIQKGSNGYTSEAYITKKLNGKIVSTTLLSKDTYKAVNQVVKIGTKVVSAPPASKPTNTPSDNNNNTNSDSNTNNNASGTTNTTPEIPGTNTGTQDSTTNTTE